MKQMRFLFILLLTAIQTVKVCSAAEPLPHYKYAFTFYSGGHVHRTFPAGERAELLEYLQTNMKVVSQTLGLSVEFLPKRNFGIGLSYFSNSFTFTDRYTYSFTKDYQDYITGASIHPSYGYKFSSRSFQGKVYHRQIFKWLVLEPGIHAELTSIFIPGYYIFLKEEGSNFTKEIYYKDKSGLSFGAGGGVKIMAMFYKAAGFFIHPQFSYMIPNLKYDIEAMDVFGNTENSTLASNNPYFNFPFIIGFNIYFSRKEQGLGKYGKTGCFEEFEIN